MHYLTQTVYSMAGYRTLQDIVSGYFAHRHWYCGEDRDDDLRSWPLAERWKDERDSCYVSAIPRSQPHADSTAAWSANSARTPVTLSVN
jgi:hypothetical protein